MMPQKTPEMTGRKHKEVLQDIGNEEFMNS
jgi:hypothetical protein